MTRCPELLGSIFGFKQKKKVYVKACYKYSPFRGTAENNDMVAIVVTNFLNRIDVTKELSHSY